MEGRWAIYISTPNKEKDPSLHWTTKMETEPTVLKIPCRMICEDCLKLPPSEMIKCTCLGGRFDNPLKDIKIRKAISQNTDPSRIMSLLEEHYGYQQEAIHKGYNPEAVKKLFDPNRKWKPTSPPAKIRYFFMYVDPNAGGITSDTAALCMFFDEASKRFVCVYLDTRCTGCKKEFVAFVFQAIDMIHEKIRKKNPEIAIVVAVESQKAFDGETIEEELEDRKLAGNISYDNVHILADEQRERDKTGQKFKRFGVNISHLRQKDMHTIVEDILEYDLFYWHEDLCTASPYGLQIVQNILIEQLLRYRAPCESDINVGYDKNMKARTGDLYGGKFKGQRDDLSDCFHGCPAWMKEVLKPYYRRQREKWMGLQ